MPSAFISYSWDSNEHKDWVHDLATRLRADGIETILDQWHTVPGDQLPKFMEMAVRESDYVLIICTLRYKQRSDRREGGVGYEGDVITGEVVTRRNERKFIPILRSGDWEAAAPTWLLGKYHIDLRGSQYSDTQYQDLVTTLLGTRPQAPPVRTRPLPSADAASSAPAKTVGRSSGPPVDFEPIKIAGVIEDEIGVPRNDGTRGSGLYKVPFRFNRRPPPEWAGLFIEAWDHPSIYTSMHRPGIATIYSDRVVLDGTTVEEVEKYHRRTLLLAADTANKEYVEMQRRRRSDEERERARIEAHRKSVEEAAKRLDF